MAVELPDEVVAFNYQGLVVPAAEEWTAAAELRARHFLPAARLKELGPRLMTCRGQVAAERGGTSPDAQPVEAGFIDLPQAQLDNYRRKGDASDLGKCLTLAQRLKEEVDRVVLLGAGGALLGARALFAALKPAYHNEMPPESRLGVPRIYFDGYDADNDSLQDLLDLIQVACVDPENRAERWAVAALSKSGATLEPLVALRVFRREAQEYYGLRSEWLKKVFAAATGSASRLRNQFRAQGHDDAEMLAVPDNVSSRFSVFSAMGLLPAALMGLDVRALLLGAATMTKRFLEEPYERNPVLQLAGINYLMTEELHKPVRVLALWRKLEALGQWYAYLLSEGLGKQGRGVTAVPLVQTRDLHAHGQVLQEGPRDRFVTNFVVKNPRAVPIPVQMADQNEDDLNALARKNLPDLNSAALRGANRAYFDAARPTADLVLPSLSEHVVGQFLQMLMLATVVEGRLLGVNPYGQPGGEVYRRHMRDLLKQ